MGWGEVKKELEDLVVNNLGLVYDVVNKHKSALLSVFEYEDAIQMGSEALIKAANTYDSTRQIAFSTYAYTCIRNHLSTQIHLAKQKQTITNKVSLDAVIIGEDDNYSLLYYLQDDINIAETIADNSMVPLLYKYIDELGNDFQRQVMYLRLRDRTFEQIAQILDKPQSVIYTTYQKALNALRYKFKNDRGD